MEYIINFDAHFPSKVAEPLNTTLFKVIIQIILFLSLCLFCYSLFIRDQDVIELECPSLFRSRQGKIEIGKAMKKNRKKHKFFLPIDDLERHMFVCGATGTGKSNFIQNFLVNFKKHYNTPFLLVEFKGEYHYLQNIIEDLLIIKPGENFSINVFDPEGSNPEIHAERVFDILKSGQFLDDDSDYSPQMEKVLVDILTIAYRSETRQNWEDFYNQCEIYLNNQKDKIPFLHQTITSITNRIRRFSLGPLKVIFGKKHELKIKDLFEMNVLFDLSSIIRLGGEKEDALFFLNMILKYLWDKNLEEGSTNYSGIKHITMVEDAQYFAPQSITNQTKLSTYLEDIALLLRGTGECLISIATRPQVSNEILANCGILITFKNHMQKEFMCELLNLEEEHEDYLSILEQGQCLVRVNSIKRPFLLWVPYIKRSFLSSKEIDENNKYILKKIKKSVFEIGVDNEKKKEVRGTSKKEKNDTQNVYSNIDEDETYTKLKDYLNKLAIQQENKNNETTKNKDTILDSELGSTDNEIHFYYCQICNSFHDKSKDCLGEK
ncbi:MAG: ATP-binding protein [Promethearchaeota archaeon]